MDDGKQYVRANEIHLILTLAGIGLFTITKGLTGMRYLALGIDPGMDGGIVLTENRKLLLKQVTPTKKAQKGRMYQHDLIEQWLDMIERDYCDDDTDVVCGLEWSRPIPAKKVLKSTRYYKFADDIKKAVAQSRDMANEAARSRFLTDAVIGHAEKLIKDFAGGRESNYASFVQGMGVVLWVIHLHYHQKIRWQAFDPKTWQKEVCQSVPGATAKDRAWEACKRLYPGADFTKSERARVPHDGLVDAACVAEAARRSFHPHAGGSGVSLETKLRQRGELPF